MNDSSKKRKVSSGTKSLPDECMALVFSFVGGNARKKNSSIRVSEAGKFYGQLSKVCRSWKRSLDASLPLLITNLELVVDGRMIDMENMENFLTWLNKFRIRLAVIKVPVLSCRERLVLFRILRTMDAITDLRELSIEGIDWQETYGTEFLSFANSKDAKENLSMGSSEWHRCGDTALHELVAAKCRNLRRLWIPLNMDGPERHKPSTDLFCMANLTSLAVMPAVFPCTQEPVLDLSYITNLVESLSSLEALELHGSHLEAAPNSKLTLVSKSLRVLHGYSFPDHITVNVNRCTNLPFYL